MIHCPIDKHFQHENSDTNECTARQEVPGC